MSIYTKRGDKGITDMARTRNISKSDDRIRLSGAIDELNSHIGLMISMISSQETVQFLESVQSTLNLVATGVEDPYNRKCRISEERVTALETEIDNLEKLCPRPVTEKLKGNSSLAAEIDIARTVARRAECSLAQVSVKFGADAGSRKFLNRLSDYFFILARYTENAEGKAGSYEMQKTEIEVTGAKAEAKNIKTQNTEAEAVNTMDTLAGTVNINEAVIREVLKRIGVQTRITLDIAKKLIDRIEQEALRRGAHAVISGKKAYITKATSQLMRDLGSIPSPTNCFLLNLGLETLPLRVERHCYNAQKIAEFLNAHEKVSHVNYAGLPDDKYYALAQKYMNEGRTCGVISFELTGGREAAVRFMDSLKLATIATHVAASKTMILHPASHTHRQMNDEQLVEAGVSPGMIRLSVGIENVEDIIADIEQALKNA